MFGKKYTVPPIYHPGPDADGVSRIIPLELWDGEVGQAMRDAGLSPDVEANVFRPGGTKRELDRNYRRLNIITFASFVVTIGLWRLGLTKAATIALIGLLIAIPAYMGAVETGGFWRTAKWTATVTVVAIFLAFVFRYIDKGLIG